MENSFVEVSRGILYLSLAVSALGISFFVCWNMYYMVKTFRNFFDITENVKIAVKRIGESVENAKGKGVFMLSAMVTLFEGMQKIGGFFKSDKKSEDIRK